MTIAELIAIVTNRIAALHQARAHAVSVGDVQRVSTIDADVVETETTLAQLHSLTI